MAIFFFAARNDGVGSRKEMATAVVGGVDAVVGAYGVGTTAVARADEGVVAGVGAKDFGEVVVDAAEGAAGVGGAAGVVAVVVGVEVAEAVLDDEDAEETPFMRSMMAFICCNISVHLDIDADISDSDAESSDTVAMANSIWGKKIREIFGSRSKALITNCNDLLVANRN